MRNKAQVHVVAAVADVVEHLLFPIRGIDSDNRAKSSTLICEVLHRQGFEVHPVEVWEPERRRNRSVHHFCGKLTLIKQHAPNPVSQHRSGAREG